MLYSSITLSNFHPEVNDDGEVVYMEIPDGGTISQIFSTERGQITFLPDGAWAPSINNSGEIIYISFDENGVWQLFSTFNGQITDYDSFSEPLYNGLPYIGWTDQDGHPVEFGWYLEAGATYFSDLNDKGQIVFNVFFAEGPYWVEDCPWDDESCWHGIIRSRLYLATPYPTIDDILDFIAEHEDIVGVGSGNSADSRLNAFRNMLETASDLIEAGDNESACGQLKSITKKCDQKDRPPDFITGDPETVEDLMGMIIELKVSLECD